MKLADFLKDRDIKVADFAERIGRSRKQVHEYMAGTATPRGEAMVKIIDATEGEVTANDFLPSGSAEAVG